MDGSHVYVYGRRCHHHVGLSLFSSTSHMNSLSLSSPRFSPPSSQSLSALITCLDSAVEGSRLWRPVEDTLEDDGYDNESDKSTLNKEVDEAV